MDPNPARRRMVGTMMLPDAIVSAWFLMSTIPPCIEPRIPLEACDPNTIIVQVVPTETIEAPDGY